MSRPPHRLPASDVRSGWPEQRVPQHVHPDDAFSEFDRGDESWSDATADSAAEQNRTEAIFDIIDFCEMDKNWEVKVEYVSERLRKLGV